MRELNEKYPPQRGGLRNFGLNVIGGDKKKSGHDNQDARPGRKEVVVEMTVGGKTVTKRLIIGVIADGVSTSALDQTKLSRTSGAVAGFITANFPDAIEKYLKQKKGIQEAIQLASQEVQRRLVDEKDYNDGASTAAVYVFDTTDRTIHTATAGDSLVFAVNRRTKEVYVLTNLQAVFVDQNDSEGSPDDLYPRLKEGDALNANLPERKKGFIAAAFSGNRAEVSGDFSVGLLFNIYMIPFDGDFILLAGSDQLEKLFGSDLRKHAVPGKPTLQRFRAQGEMLKMVEAIPPGSDPASFVRDLEAQHRAKPVDDLSYIAEDVVSGGILTKGESAAFTGGRHTQANPILVGIADTDNVILSDRPADVGRSHAKLYERSAAHKKEWVLETSGTTRLLAHGDFITVGETHLFVSLDAENNITLTYVPADLIAQIEREVSPPSLPAPAAPPERQEAAGRHGTRADCGYCRRLRDRVNQAQEEEAPS